MVARAGQLAINTTLWNTIQMLFPKAAAAQPEPRVQAAPACSGSAAAAE